MLYLSIFYIYSIPFATLSLYNNRNQQIKRDKSPAATNTHILRMLVCCLQGHSRSNFKLISTDQHVELL